MSEDRANGRPADQFTEPTGPAGAPQVPHQPYVLNNDEPTASPLLEYLATIMDQFSQKRLTKARFLPAGRCLEIGAGSGSIACWMADEIGPGGLVVATDIKPQHIPNRTRLQVIKHDIASDEPLPHESYDLIHARLVLAHLPDRWALVAKLADLVAPGGALVIEEWGAWAGPMLTCPDPGGAALYEQYQETLLEVFRSAGNDPTWALHVPEAMADAGLTDLDVVGETASWPGGTAGCKLPALVSVELADRLMAAGMDAEDLARLRKILVDPKTLVLGNVTISTIGRRRLPTTASCF